MRSVSDALTSETIWTNTPLALPDDVRALFAKISYAVDIEEFYNTLAWYDLLCRTASPAGAEAGFLLVRHQGHAISVLPIWRISQGRLESLTSPYTCLHAPLFGPDLDELMVARVGVAMAAALRRIGMATLRLDALDPQLPALAAFLRGLRQGGLAVLEFAHFGNWCSQIALDGGPASWEFYQARLDGALRETIRRRTARVQRDGGFRFEMITTPSDLAHGIAAFETVYAQSWKDAEPHPQFNAEMMTLCAAHRLLRLAVLWHHAMPVAVQYWLVAGGVAQVLKLAHVPGYERTSPGTVLTAWAIAQILGEGVVHSLDFGRGDDDYKRLWVETRRQRIGVMVANPRRLAGLTPVLRHRLGRLRRFFAS